MAEIKLPVAEDECRRTSLVRAQWLRAAILGANDGLLSTTSLMLGVGAAKEDRSLMIVSGIAGAVAGACSMAVGEFVSVSTQRDIEKMSLNKSNVECEDVKIQESPAAPSPARSPFMKALAMRGDEAEVEETLPNPYKAAGASALAFLCGSLVPIATALVFSKQRTRCVAIVVVTTLALLVFGGAGARIGGSPVRISALRVLVGGWISMAVTYGLLKPLDKDHD
ncbi:vacuolar iron transporter homolog 2-like [Salvia miltiorrhiza]|uniref:vacuolar iron transporter homolog 2-like n=1 Tax=Salvia miltiorrhiza TaxID=226208 RepID=UPI0025AD9618|nr:vacuolar iron transporter homolog 2-like [Salvia miltiorrhiza]